MLLLAWLLVLTSAPSAFGAEDHVVERAVFEDVTGAMTIDAVPGQHFQPIGSMLAEGYSPSVFWLRLTVRPAADGTPLTLRIRPTFLDSVTLYEPDPAMASGWRVDVTGDQTPFADRSFRHVSLGFDLEPATMMQTVYLRIETKSSHLLNVEALTGPAAAAAELRMVYIHAVFLGMMSLVLGWAVLSCLVRFDPVTFWFAVAISGYIGYVLAFNGYLALILPHALASHADWLSTVLFALVPLLAMMLHRAVWLSLAPPAIMVRLGYALLLASALVLALAISGLAPRRAMQLNAMLVIMLCPFLLVMAFGNMGPWPFGMAARRWVYGLLAATLLVWMLPLLGNASLIRWSLHDPLVHGLIYTVLVFGLLQHRSQLLHNQLWQMQGALRREKGQRKAQDRIMAMVTHDMRTPLSVIRLNIAEGQLDRERLRAIEDALADASSLIENSTLVDMLDSDMGLDVTELVALDRLVSDAIGRVGAYERVRIEAGPVPPIASNRQLVERLMANLLDNALKYSPPASMVHVVMASHRENGVGGVLLRIRNRPGHAGFPDAERLFDKHYRASRARHMTGYGLGLYIVQGIVKLLGGTVRYEPGKDWIDFVLWLPSATPMRLAQEQAEPRANDIAGAPVPDR